MEAIIQNRLSYKDNHFVYQQGVVNEINRQFVEILSEITESPTEYDLRVNISKLPKYTHFLIGFGGHHMWVKQIINGEAVQQVIFVKFD